MTHEDLKHISEWQYIEMVDGHLMMEEERTNRDEDLIGYIADFFSHAMLIDIAGKVKKSNVPDFEGVRKGIFMTTRERKEIALKEWMERQQSESDRRKSQEAEQRKVEEERAKLFDRFGIK